MYIIQLPVPVSVCVCIYVCILHIITSYNYIRNLHIKLSSMTYSCILQQYSKVSILLHSKIVWKPTEPDHQTTNIDCPPTMKKLPTRLLLLGDSVTAWPGSLRRLLSLRAASAPAAASPDTVASLGQGAEPDTVANALLRPGCFNVWILVFVFQGFSNTYCRLVKLVQYSEHCFQIFFFEEQRDG